MCSLERRERELSQEVRELARDIGRMERQGFPWVAVVEKYRERDRVLAHLAVVRVWLMSVEQPEAAGVLS